MGKIYRESVAWARQRKPQRRHVDWGVYNLAWRSCTSDGACRPGDVKARLTAHRVDPAVGAYRPNGGLWVTWAAVSQQALDGVERYLSETLRPLVGDRFPEAAPIPVNLPWAA